LACASRRFEIIKFLVEKGVDLECKDCTNKIPIFLLLESCDDMKVIQYMLSKNVNLNLVDKYGYCVNYACRKNDYKIKQLVWEAYLTQKVRGYRVHKKYMYNSYEHQEEQRGKNKWFYH